MRKCVLVIGGSGKIGQAILKDLLNQGEIVVATYNSRVIPTNRNLITKYVDVRSMDSLIDLANYIQAEGYTVSKIVYNSGVTKDTPIYCMEESDFKDVIDVNLYGFFRVCKIFLQDVSLNKGSVVSISSIAALVGSRGQANYACSKAALIAFTRSIASEYAKLGVRANCVIPGWIESTMTENFTPEKKVSIQQSVPLRRYGLPEEVSAVVAFLLSDKSSYLTGQSIVVDGGVTNLRT